MIVGRFSSAQTHVTHTPTGRQCVASPGIYSGLLNVVCHSNPREVQEDPILQISFGFLTANNEAWTSIYHYTIAAFAPTLEMSCDLVPEDPAGWCAHFRVVYDSRDEWVFRLRDGRTMKAVMKYNDLFIRFAEREDGVLVNLKFYGDHGGQVGVPDEYYVVQYKLPIEQFLWRRAARITEDSFECEALDHTDLRFMPTGVDTYKRAGITPSPVVIEP